MGTDAPTYRAIRGLDAFDKVCEGIQACAEKGLRAGIRVTLQRTNIRQLARFVALAGELNAASVSFLAVDVGSGSAFGRLAPAQLELAQFADAIGELQVQRPVQFESEFIVESPAKLRDLLQYFTALHGRATFPRVRCNAPQFSAVIGARGQLQPCFFIGAPSDAVACSGWSEPLNWDPQRELRRRIAAGERRECERCVCAPSQAPLNLGARLSRVPRSSAC